MTRTERERAASAVYSANIRAELARRNMQQTELAELAEMNVEAVRRRMRLNPDRAAGWTPNELERVARALQVPVATLMAGAERAKS